MNLVDQEVIAELECQVTRLRYRYPMDIPGFLNFPDENVVAITPDIDDHLHMEANDADANQMTWRRLPVSAKQPQRMILSLETGFPRIEKNKIPGLSRIFIQAFPGLFQDFSTKFTYAN